MAKKIIKVTESKLNHIISEEVKKVLKEGIDIDTETTPHTVGFNPNHQEYVDTNDPWKPHPIYNEVNGYKVISVFTRKQTDDRLDGNPLIYALKGKDWVFRDEHYDLMALLRRFVAVTKELNEKFDVIITTPSSNQLNNRIFDIVERIIPHENAIKDVFTKYDANYVYDYMIDKDSIAQNTNTTEDYNKVIREIFNAVIRMNKQNGGVFSYRYLPQKEYRNYVIQSMYLSDSVKSDLERANEINGKRVLVLDDTVASGKTISDSAEALMETFEPMSITFLTLFSPLTEANDQ